MELVFLLLLIVLMIWALGSGFPVAFSLPGSAILAIGAAAFFGWLIAGDPSAYFAQGGPVQWLTAGVTNFRGIYWEVERDTLIAIPLFVFMGIMLQRSKIAEDLLVTMAQLFGPVPGGLGISVVFVGALLAATTGIVGATVVAMGLISLPAMMRNNYSNSLATGTIAASGTLGQIIPPSIVLIILADQLASAVDQASTTRKALYKAGTGQISMPSEFDIVSTSAGDMFMGAFVPGLVLVGLYMVFILVISLLRPHLAPAVHFDGKYDSRFLRRVLLILVPPLTLIFVVLGSIIMGIATVNQAGAIGAVGATIMAGYRLREGHRGAYRPAMLSIASVVALVMIANIHPINIKNIDTGTDAFVLVLAILAASAFLVSVVWSGWRAFRIEDTLRGVMVETAKTTALVFIILLGAAMLTAAFRGFGGEDLVKDFLTGLSGGFWVQFIIVMGVIFVLGFFLDFIEIAVVVVPIVAPILLAEPSANITAVWLGVMIGLNIQTSFLTPPFGFALFYLRGVAPKSVRTIEIYKGVVAFICLQLVGLAIVGAWPWMVNYLPNRISLTSDTAPPPQNPKLQFCLEASLFRQYDARETEILAAIDTAGRLDLSYLPKDLQATTAKAFGQAAKTFELVEQVRAAEAAVAAKADAYRPALNQVRNLQRDMRRIDVEAEEIRSRIARLSSASDEEKADLPNLEARIGVIEAGKKDLEAQIPESWAELSKTMQALQQAEDKARKLYRRNVDAAYAPIGEIVAVVGATDRLDAIRGDIEALKDIVRNAETPEAVKKFKNIEKAVGQIEGAKEIRKLLSKARRALKAKVPDPDKALDFIDKALQVHAEEMSWRSQAKNELLPDLGAYEATIRDNIGLRQQAKLPVEQVKKIVGCLSQHRDISLYF